MSRREFAKRRNLLASRLPVLRKYAEPRFGGILIDAEGQPFLQFIGKQHNYASLHVDRRGRNLLVLIARRVPSEDSSFSFLAGAGPRAAGRMIARHLADPL